ncbi:MAG: hypothetical protein BGO55_03610 [Sphingobacteriales bacterium 50-39]|nr:hypothetical protein [Sphingobacteriales bacterium]OJW55636.1 MAG: hypothetical protein BGO55_03610 [Sphingobacteriales bacterium 50-39]
MTLITRTLVELRAKDPLNKKRLLKVVDACNTFSNKTRIKYIFDGQQYSTYSSNRDILQAWDQMEKQYGSEGPAFILTTDKDHALFAFGPREDPYGFYNEDAIEFSFIVDKPLLKPDGYFSFVELKEFFIATINSYEAYCAYIHDNQLEELIVSGFTAENMKAQLPRELWEHIPTPELAAHIPADIIARISKLITPEKFDRLSIPEAIYWFNYWNEFQVENLGEEKVKTAPCEVVEKQKNGGYILIVQKENFRADNIDQMEKMAKVYDHFNLYEIQDRFRFDK